MSTALDQAAMNAADEDMVDVQFSLRGQFVPIDYADELWCAVSAVLPWLEEDPLAGVHPLFALSPGDDRVWYLSRHSRLVLRVARHRLAAVETMTGMCLPLSAGEIGIGPAKSRELLATPVVQARCVAFRSAGSPAISEDDFLATCAADLARLGMTPRLLCGRPCTMRTDAGTLAGFGLVLVGLGIEENLRLQRIGLGGERKRGCGVFIPHKSMAAVGTIE